MGKMVMHLCVRRCLHTAGPYYTCLVFSGESFLSLFTNSRKNIQHFWKGRANRVALVWRVISREKTLIHHTPTGHTRAPRWCWFSFLSLLLLGIFAADFEQCAVSLYKTTLLLCILRSLSYRCSVSVWTLFGLLRALMTLMATDEAKWLYWIIRMKSDRHRKLIYRELPQKDSFLIESLKYKKYRLSAHGQHHLFWCWKSFSFSRRWSYVCVYIK